MILYFIYILMSFFFIFDKKKQNIFKSYFGILMLLLLIIFAGISNYSKDYENYRILHENNYNLYEILFGDSNILNPDIRIEKGYKIVMAFAKTVSNNFNFFLFIISSISLGLRYKTYKKIDKENIIFYFLFYFSFRYLPNELTQFRSSIASAIMFFALLFVVDRKLIKFLLCLILAVNFHKGTIVFMPLYFLYPYFLKIKYKSLYFIVLLLFISKIDIVGNTMDIFLKNDYHYQLIKANSQENIARFPKIPFLITFCGIIKFDKIENKYYKCAVFYMVFSLIYFIFLEQIPELAIRVSNYFYDAQAIIVGFLLNQLNEKYCWFFCKLLIIILLIIIFNSSYQTIFENIGYMNIYLN